MRSLSECRWRRKETRKLLVNLSHGVLVRDFSTRQGTFLNSGREGPSPDSYTHAHPGTRDHPSQGLAVRQVTVAVHDELAGDWHPLSWLQDHHHPACLYHLFQLSPCFVLGNLCPDFFWTALKTYFGHQLAPETFMGVLGSLSSHLLYPRIPRGCVGAPRLYSGTDLSWLSDTWQLSHHPGPVSHCAES